MSLIFTQKSDHIHISRNYTDIRTCRRQKGFFPEMCVCKCL